MAGRFGSVELRCMVEYEQMQCGMLSQYSDKTYVSMKRNAGFFPAENEQFEKFAELMERASLQVDLLGIWYNKLENYYVDQYLPNVQLTMLEHLEPYYFDMPWSQALEGKKVLVIHPFAESIEQQYKKRGSLFQNPGVLPEFDLQCYKALQTAGGMEQSQFATWFDALDFMHEEIRNLDYEVAILGCGAYGFPLASMIKQDGKQAIHLGGATQILFGIKGKRWDEHPVISKLYNDSWVRPEKQEQIKNCNQIENGCYW